MVFRGHEFGVNDPIRSLAREDVGEPLPRLRHNVRGVLPAPNVVVKVIDFRRRLVALGA